MKRRFSKILGVGLTLALLTSLLLTAAPVSAVTTPVVTLFDGDDGDPVANPAYVISKDNIYKVLFTVGTVVPADGQIVVGFEAGTNITDIGTGDVAIDNTEGIGGGTPPAVISSAVATGTYPAAQTLTITLNGSQAIGAGAMVQLTIGVLNNDRVTNPNTAGTYNLTVETQKADDTVIEAAVTSADYTIKVPTIAGLPGVASVYNPTGVLMAQENDLVTAVDAAGVDYTIYVGPGTYAISGTLNLDVSGLTFVSTAGAATTIIDVPTGVLAISITGDDVIADGFTIESDVKVISISGSDGAIVQNNVITVEGTEAVGIAAEGGATDVTISGNTLDNATIYLSVGLGSTVSGNSGGTINISPAFSDNVITGNTLTGIDRRGIVFNGEAGTHLDNLIEGNILSSNLEYGIDVESIAGGTIYTNLTITGNTIIDNGIAGIRINENVAWGTSNAIKFNTITGNTDYGIQNDSGVDVDATFNWWGTTVAADIAAMVLGDVTTDPFLADTAEAVFSASDVGTGATLDAKDEVGVKVSVANATSVDTIAVAEYIANPEEAIADAIAFFDVYVAGDLTPDPDGSEPMATIKFYAGDANTEVYIWSADTETWGAVEDPKFSAYGGYVYVTVDPAMLAGTPFALVAGAAAAIDDPDDPLTLISPAPGERDIPLTPTFSWTQVAAAAGYYFELADNANFVAPLVKLDGDLGRLIVTAYAYVGELDYSSALYWRVKAVSGTEAAGDLAESAWRTAVFITMNEPEEPTPPVVVQETPAPIIVIEETPAPIIQPIVEVITPPATPITPAWIYVIIAVGAVLVIALVVLVLRTRRVA